MNITRQDIEEMEAGSDLDCLVAEHIMGLKLYDNDQFSLGSGTHVSRGHVPSFSSVIGEAMRVLVTCEMKYNLPVSLSLCTNQPVHVAVGSCAVSYKSAPLAICQAAMRAIISLKAIPAEPAASL